MSTILAVNWSDIQNGEQLQSVRGKINTFNRNVIVEVDRLDVLTQQLDTTVGDHSSRISTLETTVIDHEDRINALESVSPVEAVFEYDTVNDVTITSTAPDWQQLMEVDVANLISGVYKYTISVAWTLDSTTSSAGLRYSLDGGTTWIESWEEPKDRTDVRHASFASVLVFPTDSPAHLLVQVSKENSGDTLTIKNGSLIIERERDV
ncbi:MAG: hypothetical protein B6U76_00160 [Desulfurococcales archaeon ex4484_217_2]|nr:MAG: hypothetical protein B6U76_00160 [Desulfurococcales archaeon ex4484_217_2]